MKLSSTRPLSGIKKNLMLNRIEFPDIQHIFKVKDDELIAIDSTSIINTSRFNKFCSQTNIAHNISKGNINRNATPTSSSVM